MLCPSPGEGTGKRLRDASSELAILGIVIKKSLSFAAPLCIDDGRRNVGEKAAVPADLQERPSLLIFKNVLQNRLYGENERTNLHAEMRVLIV